MVMLIQFSVLKDGSNREYEECSRHLSPPTQKFDCDDFVQSHYDVNMLFF